MWSIGEQNLFCTQPDGQFHKRLHFSRNIRHGDRHDVVIKVLYVDHAFVAAVNVNS
jgi:hypothetical protein